MKKSERGARKECDCRGYSKLYKERGPNICVHINTKAVYVWTMKEGRKEGWKGGYKRIRKVV